LKKIAFAALPIAALILAAPAMASGPYNAPTPVGPSTVNKAPKPVGPSEAPLPVGPFKAPRWSGRPR
jgi:hypothetical protein